jgi:hypothetical protein
MFDRFLFGGGPQRSTQTRHEKLILIFFFLIAFAVLLRVGATPAPIYASDEYAYLKHGLDLGKSPDKVQSARDPHLQGVSNYVYFWIVQLAARISSDPTTALRILNFACYFVVLPLLGGSLLRRHSGPGAHLWFLGLLALLPASVYVLSPMPEILFATVYTAIAVLTVLLIRSAPSVAGLLAGAGLGILVYVKPHAAAAILSFALFFFCHSLRNWRSGEWLRRLLPITFVAALALGIFFVNLTILGQLSFAPKFAGDLYTGAIQSAFSLSHFRKTVQGVSGYALLHGLVLIVLFPLALAGSIQALGRFTQRKKKKTAWDVFDNLALLTTISAAAFIAMTAHYTHYTGAADGSDSNRLHGRYLIVIFPSLLIVTCHVFSILQGKPHTRLSTYVHNRWVLGAFTLTAIGTTWFLTHSKLFPWDYPELFSLYSKINNYWGWSAPLGLRIPVLSGGLSILLACLVFPRYAARLLVFGQAIFFSASLFLTTFWQETHARMNEPRAAFGRALRNEAGPNAEDLLLVGGGRFGDLSYALCGLLANPWVMSASQDSELTAAMIPPGVKLVATLGSYDVKFPFVSYSERGAHRTYGLDVSTIRTYSLPPPLWDRKEFVVHTSSNPCTGALFGFNTPEPWGAWTADDKAIILLPYQVQGNLSLKFRCWVAAKGEESVVLALGDATLTLQPDTTPTEFNLPVSVTSPTDRIQIHFPGARSKPWDRRIGVTISDIAVRPEP